MGWRSHGWRCWVQEGVHSHPVEANLLGHGFAGGVPLDIGDNLLSFVVTRARVLDDEHRGVYS